MNITAVSSKINGFLCPSSITVPSGAPYIQAGTVNGVNYYLPGNNYFFCTGSSVMWRNDDGAAIILGNKGGNIPYVPNGLFAVGGIGYSIHQITDGTSNTVAAGEWRTGDFNDFQLSIQDFVGNQNYRDWGASTRDLVASTGNMPAGAAGVMPALNQCAQSWTSMTGNFGTNGQRSWNGRLWAVGMYAYTLGNVVVPPNSPYPYCEFWSNNSDWDAGGIIGLTSFHPGGANVLVADGSVRFLKSSISWQTLWALGSRDQDEPISSDQY
jgi:prepilin-type processing-associated H-X9-DG protein